MSYCLKSVTYFLKDSVYILAKYLHFFAIHKNSYFYHNYFLMILINILFINYIAIAKNYTIF